MRREQVRKRSKYSGRKYKRYKRGYWRRYRRQRRGKFLRAIANLRRRMECGGDPYTVKSPGTVGRPPTPPKNVMMSILVKTLFALSYRDAESFLLWICGTNALVIGKIPAAPTMQGHMKDIPEAYLEDMIRECVKILEECDVTIIMDATGVSTRQYGRWRTSRLSSRKVKRKFVKMHLSVDSKRNIILIGASTKGWKGDHKFGLLMLRMLKRTFERYNVCLEDTLADSYYRSRMMAKTVGDMGGRPLIKIKSGDTPRKEGVKEWVAMVRFQTETPEEFMRFYCNRVIIEGIISALKNTFGTVVRSRKRHNQNIEVLCRMVLWNYMQIEPEEF